MQPHMTLVAAWHMRCAPPALGCHIPTSDTNTEASFEEHEDKAYGSEAYDDHSEIASDHDAEEPASEVVPDPPSVPASDLPPLPPPLEPPKVPVAIPVVEDELSSARPQV